MPSPLQTKKTDATGAKSVISVSSAKIAPPKRSKIAHISLAHALFSAPGNTTVTIFFTRSSMAISCLLIRKPKFCKNTKKSCGKSKEISENLLESERFSIIIQENMKRGGNRNGF